MAAQVYQSNAVARQRSQCRRSQPLSKARRLRCCASSHSGAKSSRVTATAAANVTQSSFTAGRELTRRLVSAPTISTSPIRGGQWFLAAFDKKVGPVGRTTGTLAGGFVTYLSANSAGGAFVHPWIRAAFTRSAAPAHTMARWSTIPAHVWPTRGCMLYRPRPGACRADPMAALRLHAVWCDPG